MTIGLTPKPHSSGGKEKLGKITKMGNRYLRRLLYLGAPCWKHAFGMTAQITARSHKPAGEDWLWNMLQRKPRSDRSATCKRGPLIGTKSTRNSSWRAASKPQN